MADDEGKTPDDKLYRALQAERGLHRTAAAALKTAQARIAELEQVGTLGGSPNASKVAEVIAASVAAKVAAETGELQKKLTAAELQLGEATTAKATLEAKLNRRTVDDVVREAAMAAHVRTDALPDVMTIAGLELKLNESGDVLTPDGQDVNAWLDARKAASPHWWPASKGAGSRGSGEGAPPETSNPFSPGPAFSLTKQGEILRASPERAAMLQQQARATMN